MDSQRITDFANNTIETAATLVGATAHVQRISLVEKGELPDHVAAAYSALIGRRFDPEGGEIMWQRSSAEVMDAFLAGTYRRLPEQQQLQFLCQVRGELSTFLHEVLHSIGTADPVAFAKGFMRDGSDNGLRAVLEGSNELITQAFMPEMIRRLGLDRIDPRITQLPTPDMGAYAGQVTAMYQVYRGAADALGVPISDVLRAAAQLESGGAALHRIVTAVLSSRGQTPDPRAVARVESGIKLELAACQDEFFTSIANDSAAIDPRSEIARLRELGTRHGERAVAAMRQELEGGVRRRMQPQYQFVPLSPISAQPVPPLRQHCGFALA